MIAHDAGRFTHVGEDGSFSGYAAKWGRVDHYNHVVQAGAFTKTLELVSAGKRSIKMALQHDLDDLIGSWVELSEDEIGLRVQGKLNLDVRKARETKSMMQSGQLDGLSIGFDDYVGVERDGVEYISEIDLVEISIVTRPAQEAATVDSVSMTEVFTMDAPRVTKDGYLAASARIARTGIQLYKGYELGRPDLDTVRVYRPEDEVFHRDAFKSMSNRPVTRGHPPVAVNSKNWRAYAVGTTGEEVVRDGEFVRVPLSLMDHGAIDAYTKGENQLSVGYTCDVAWESGTSSRGEVYDAVQKNIRANHLAVVPSARGGPELRIGDDHHTGESMTTLTKLVVDGIQVEMADISAQHVARHIKALETQAANLKSKLEEEEKKAKEAKDSLAEAVTKHDAAMKDATAKIVTLESQVKDSALTPAKLEDAVKERVATTEKAKAVLGDKLGDVSKLSSEEIRAHVVNTKLGDSAKGWDASQIAVAFTTMTADVKPATGGSSGAQVLDAAILAAHGNRSGASHTNDAAEASYVERETKLSNAWKGKAA